jgi:hypothetical protein
MTITYNNAVSVINEIDEDGSPNEDAYYMAVDDKIKFFYVMRYVVV